MGGLKQGRASPRGWVLWKVTRRASWHDWPSSLFSLADGVVRWAPAVNQISDAKHAESCVHRRIDAEKPDTALAYMNVTPFRICNASLTRSYPSIWLLQAHRFSVVCSRLKTKVHIGRVGLCWFCSCPNHFPPQDKKYTTWKDYLLWRCLRHSWARCLVR